jgi:hypothetical protein
MTIRADVRTLLEAFLDMSQRSACAINVALFLVQSKTSGLRTTLLKCRIIRVSKLLDVGLKEFCCT